MFATFSQKLFIRAAHTAAIHALGNLRAIPPQSRPQNPNEG